MLPKNRHDREQKQKQKDTFSAAEISGLSDNRGGNRSNMYGQQESSSKRRKQFDDDEDEYPQKDYSIQQDKGGSKRVKPKAQNMTELKEFTSIVSDDNPRNVGRDTDKVEIGSPRFNPNDQKQKKNISRASSKHDFDNINEPLFGQSDLSRKIGGKMKKEVLNLQESEMIEKQYSIKSGSSRRQKKGHKVENYFYFTQKLPPKQKEIVLEEEGLDPEEMQRVSNCVLENNPKQTKNRRKKAKLIREITQFYTSKFFYFFHITEVVIYWLLIVLFPELNVINCIQGHHWMTHVSFGMYLILTFIFDFVFLSQYMEKEANKQQLESFDGKNYGPRPKFWAFLVSGEALLQLIITQCSLLQIYCVVIFITIIRVEDLKDYLIPSLISLLLLILFKIYAFIAMLGTLFGCIQKEDKKRKLTYRALLFSEFRLQALNVDYVEYNKRKTEFVFGFLKLLFFDVVQFALMIHYLLNTACGKMTNVMVYVGIAMHLASAYFGFLSRFITAFYHCKRVNSYKRRVNLKVSNKDLQYFGFRNLRSKMSANKKVESIEISGETYEYLLLDEDSTRKLGKTFNAIPEKHKVEFFSLDKVKIENIRQAKNLLQNIKENFPTIKFVSIQQSSLCANFVLQLTRYLSENERLLRYSSVHNKFTEDEVLLTLESCLDHANLEVLQIAERLAAEDEDIVEGKKEKSGISKISILKGIQTRVQNNDSLKKLEIRYFQLSRPMIQSLLRGIQKNTVLQKLILTHNTLGKGGPSEFQLLGETLRLNGALRIVDFSYNENLDDSENNQTEITQGLYRSTETQIHRIYVSSTRRDIKEIYQKFQEDCDQFQVYMNGKLLEDVDIQEQPSFQAQPQGLSDSDAIKQSIENDSEY